MSPEQLLNTLRTQDAAILEQLAPQFALSPEEVARIEENAVQEIPLLLARTYKRAVTTGLHYMQQLVPNMVERQMRTLAAQISTEQEFFSKFPGLNRGAHGQDIIAVAKALKAHNPNLTKDQLFALTGAAVSAKHGIVGNGQAGHPVAVPRAPSQGAFRPVAGGSPAGFQQAAVADQNPWAGLGMDWDE